MKRYRATSPARQGDGHRVASEVRVLTSAEIAAVYNARTGSKMTSADVRHVLKKAHDKIAKALLPDFRN